MTHKRSRAIPVPRPGRWNWRSALLFGVTILLAASCPRSWLFERLEVWSYDMREALVHRARSGGMLGGLARPSTRTEQMVVVALDEESLSRSGERYPLPRRHLATLIDRLRTAGASVIALDMFLQGKSTDSLDDRLLQEAITRSGRVIFAQRWLLKGRDVYTRPNDPFFATGMLDEATILFMPGPDQVVRHAYLFHRIDGHTLPSLSLLSVIHHWRLKTSEMLVPEASGEGDLVLLHKPEGGGERTAVEIQLEYRGLLLVDFAGPRLPFPVVPLFELEARLRTEPELLRGKIVLVGVTAAASQDMHAVPVTHDDHTQIPGCLIHAYAIRDLLAGSALRRTGQWVDVLAIAAIGILSCLVFMASGRSRLVLWLGLIVGGYIALATLLLLTRGVWLACALPLGVAVTVFVEVLALTVLSGRPMEDHSAADSPHPEAERLAKVRGILSTRSSETLAQLQGMLASHGPSAPPEISWGLAMAFVQRGQVSLALPHAALLTRAMLPLKDLHELAAVLQENGALSEAEGIFRWIQSRDLAYRDVAVRLVELENRDRQVPEALRQALAGRYRDLAFLGSGGMARVYCGVEQRTGERVAIKVPDPDLMAEVDTRRRFLREVSALRDVSHPGIIKIHDISTDGLFFYTMELVEGEPFRSLMETEERLALPRALALFELIADALAYIHDRGIVHRDIKPENILLDSQGRPRLTDFGVVFLEDQTRLTKTSAYVGTPAYMAPEQLEGHRPTTQVDVYAFGLMLYEALSGVNPYFVAPAARKLVVEPTALGVLVPGIPLQLERLVAECIDREPEARPADGGTLLARLRALRLDGAGATA